jgi:5-(aminomethyl)-3-furanmethanol phosphate kinase
MLTVVKVGGGVARTGGARRLAELGAALGAAAAEHRLIVVPGGGPFADAVRQQTRRLALGDLAAHRMAILAMDQLGWLLGELIPGSVTCADLDRAEATAAAGRAAILLPSAPLAGDPLPVGWDVTSDSIAAWVAGATGAARLVLAKGVTGLWARWPAAGDPIAQLSVAELGTLRSAGGAAGVDGYFATALAAAGVPAWVVDGTEPERVVALLGGRPVLGTRITP